jgi:hypothetical protein
VRAEGAGVVKLDVNGKHATLQVNCMERMIVCGDCGSGLLIPVNENYRLPRNKENARFELLSTEHGMSISSDGVIETSE